ncbi:MAG: MFS transporter [Planctomycetaceae bacterium]
MKTVAPHRLAGGGDVLGDGALAPPRVSTHNASLTGSPTRRARRRKLRKNLRSSVADGAAFSMMVGLGETYFPAFVLALGLGEIASGLIASIPLLVGAILQLISPWGVARVGSNRRWVVLSVALQATSFLPLVAGALFGRMPVTGVFAAVSLYWGAGLAGGPAWNTWMETVVPFRVRAPFFAMRTRLGQAGVLLGFLVGGLALQYGEHSGRLLPAFAAIFSVAALCRFLSGRYLWRQTEPVPTHETQRHVSLRELWVRIRAGKSERTLLYFLAVQVAVQLSGPYFSPYMLKQLGLSYVAYMALLATTFVAKIVTLPAFGRLAARLGARKLLWIGGIGIIPVSGLWLYADTFLQLVLVQFIAGTVWAAYELAMFLLFFETVKREERTGILTVFNLANAVALVVGALAGGGLLKLCDSSREAYLLLFGLSSFARAATLLVLKFTPAENSLLDDVRAPPERAA